MSSPSNQTIFSSRPASDPVPDFYRFRERAHHERTKAINMALAMAWCRITGRQSRLKSDTAFWTA